MMVYQWLGRRLGGKWLGLLLGLAVLAGLAAALLVMVFAAKGVD
jgi:hypothetical protein